VLKRLPNGACKGRSVVQSQGTLEAIGNTPVVQLKKLVPATSAGVLIKLEFFNPTGSYKDRMALAMIEEAESRGELRPGMTGLIPRMMAEAERIAASGNAYWTNQIHNVDSIKGYQTIGRELVRQVEGPIHAFCASVGTAGMLVGVSRALREAGSEARIVALEPASSAVLSGGKAGAHHVEGIGIGFPPPLLNEGTYDAAYGVEEEEGREVARRLAREEGILAGTSSGLNVAGALHVAAELGPGHTVVTVAVDSGLKYLAGDLFVEGTSHAAAR
jgi:cysteine synthase